MVLLLLNSNETRRCLIAFVGYAPFLQVGRIMNEWKKNGHEARENLGGGWCRSQWVALDPKQRDG